MQQSDVSSVAGEAARPPAARHRARILVLVCAPLAGLAIAEGVVRQAALAPGRPPKIEGALYRASPNARMQFENVPGAVATISYQPRDGAPPREIVMRVNPQGFRGPELAEEKPAGTIRIACLGDSHTFGYGVAEDETWPRRLEDALRRGAHATRVEVLNASVSAYDTEQEVAFLEERVLAFDPDVVLLQFYLNDVAMRGIEPAEGEEQPGWLMRAFDPKREGLVGLLRERSKFADLCAHGIYNRAALAYYGRTRSAPYRATSEGWVRCRAALAAARARLATEGIGFAVVLYPCLWREGGRLASDEAFATVAEFLRAEGIAYLDLGPVFAALEVDALRVDPQDYHAGARAHEIAGERVAAWLAETRRLVARGGGAQRSGAGGERRDTDGAR